MVTVDDQRSGSAEQGRRPAGVASTLAHLFRSPAMDRAADDGMARGYVIGHFLPGWGGSVEGL